jgi:hypothetical protein
MTQNKSILYQPASGDIPQSCTCTAGARELCSYCTMMNGPSSNGSVCENLLSRVDAFRLMCASYFGFDQGVKTIMLRRSH